MNNTTFGDESCGYYETVAGGAGAVSNPNLTSVIENTSSTNSQSQPLDVTTYPR